MPLPHPESHWWEHRPCSYGKIWHGWKTGVSNMKGDPLPYGDPELAGSFNRDGKAAPAPADSRRDRSGQRNPQPERHRDGKRTAGQIASLNGL